MTRPQPDDTDYERRTLANLVATIALLLVALALTWTVRAYQDSEALERCLLTGRFDCAASPLVLEPRLLRRFH